MKLFRYEIWYSIGNGDEKCIVSTSYDTKDECHDKMMEEMERIGRENVLCKDILCEIVPIE